jgi:hypothetical protein
MAFQLDGLMCVPERSGRIGKTLKSFQPMKKQVFLAAGIVLLALSAQAQISLIPKAGITLSSISYDNEPDGQQSKVGFVGGVGVEIGIVENFFSVQPELLFIQKGENYDARGVETKATLNYLEVPVLAKVSFGSQVIKGYVNAGPSLALGLTGNQKVEGGEEPGETGIRFGNPANDGRRYLDSRFDFGLQFGGGVGVGLGPGSLLADVRYGLGLTDLSDATKSKNRNFAFTLGYAIPLSGK